MTDLSEILLVAGVYAGIIMIILLVPFWWDIKKSYKLKHDAIDLINNLVNKDKLGQIDKDKLGDLMKSAAEQPEGIPGFGRVLMTLGVVIIVGIAIIHLLVLSTSLAEFNSVPSLNASSPAFNQTLLFIKDLKTKQLQMAESLLTILGGAVSAIIGFYFGTKAAEPKAEAKPAPSPSPDFSVSAAPNELAIPPGGKGNSDVTVASSNGFNSAVTLSLSGNPLGVTASFSPNLVTPPSGGSIKSNLEVSVGGSTQPGKYTLTVTGVSGSLTHTATITLEVKSITPEVKSITPEVKSKG